MKTARRHELATNILADWLGEKIEALKPYSAAASATVLALVVVIFAAVFWHQKREAGAARAWESYFSALEEQNPEKASDDFLAVAESYAQSPAGLWSRLSLADARLSNGVEDLFKDRAAARKALEEAVDDYRAVLDQAPADSLLAERATFGLAEAYESNNELDLAREQYRALLDRWPDGAFSALAKQRLADLDRKLTKDFYDWFAKQSPRTKQPKGPGVPGEKPAFNFDNLPEHPFQSGLNVGGKKPGAEKPKAEAKSQSESDSTEESKPADDKPADDKPADDKPEEGKPGAGDVKEKSGDDNAGR